MADFIDEEIICRFGIPKVIQSDHETQFVNKVIKELTAKFQIKYSLSSSYYLQSNGLIERFNRSLCEGLAKISTTVKDWDEYIQPVLFAYRIKQLRITGYSPYKLVYRKEPSLAMDKPSKGRTLVKRLIEIIDKVFQLRGDAKKTIK